MVCSRLKLVYKRLYEYGNRLTMRQMTGHLAYTITAGLQCRDIADVIYWARSVCMNICVLTVFGDNGSDVAPEAMQLIPVQQIRSEEFGIFDPAVESFGKATDRLNVAKNTKVFDQIKDISDLNYITYGTASSCTIFLCSLQIIGKLYNLFKSPMLLTYLTYVEINRYQV